MRGVELFAGCGGLALGAEAAGIEHVLLVERDRAACATLAANRRGWRVENADVRSLDWAGLAGSVDVLSGGPPCQPFSVGGRARGAADDRDMWPEALRALSAIGPRGFLFENVRGLLRPAFAPYLAWIVAALERPSLRRGAGEAAEDHLARLAEARSPREYGVRVVPLDAADHGAPQRRRRVFIMGVRSDVASEAPGLPPTHSRERLLFDQWVDGSYWRRVGLEAPPADAVPAVDRPVVAALARAGTRPALKAWRTVREALVGLGAPDGGRNHEHRAGARAYPGHTGSPLDQPSKAIKAGDHGVPGGENMLVGDCGAVRYYTTREAARLQGFPDEWDFPGSWGVNLRQVGNAVPVGVAASAFGVLASSLGVPPFAPGRSEPVARRGLVV